MEQFKHYHYNSASLFAYLLFRITLKSKVRRICIPIIGRLGMQILIKLTLVSILNIFQPIVLQLINQESKFLCILPTSVIDKVFIVLKFTLCSNRSVSVKRKLPRAPLNKLSQTIG